MKKQRDIKKMLKLRVSGKTYKEIGVVFGLTHQRVQQILKGNFKEQNPQFVKKAKFIKVECHWCIKTITRNELTTKNRKNLFCGRKCFSEHRKDRRSPEEKRLDHNKRHLDYYYRKIRTRPDFHQLIKKRNKLQKIRKTGPYKIK